MSSSGIAPAGNAVVVAVLDFDEDPEMYTKYLPKDIPVHCLLIERTTKFGRHFVADGPLPELISRVTIAVMWHHITMSKELLDHMTSLKLIVRVGVGYDNVDYEYAGQRGVAVCNIPNYGTEEVADSAMSHVLNLFRKTAWQINEVRQGRWDPRSSGSLRVRGRTLGIVGFGRIGKATALRAKAFGLDVVFYDPYRPSGEDKSLGVRRAETLQALLSQSDVVSLHCDLNKTTHHMINQQTIQWMRPGSFLVNTARGAVVELAALTNSLKSGHLAGAGIDCLEEEPISDSLLAHLPGMELTPHCAFYSAEAWLEMRTMAVEEALRFIQGQPLRNIINKEFLSPQALKTFLGVGGAGGGSATTTSSCS